MNTNDLKCINTLRVLGAEIINKAKSGHPGIVLGAAPIAHTLFTKHINITFNLNQVHFQDVFGYNIIKRWISNH